MLTRLHILTESTITEKVVHVFVLLVPNHIRLFATKKKFELIL